MQMSEGHLKVYLNESYLSIRYFLIIATSCLWQLPVW